MGLLIVFHKKINVDYEYITLNTEWKPIIQLRENCFQNLICSEWSNMFTLIYIRKKKSIYD